MTEDDVATRLAAMAHRFNTDIQKLKQQYTQILSKVPPALNEDEKKEYALGVILSRLLQSAGTVSFKGYVIGIDSEKPSKKYGKVNAIYVLKLDGSIVKIIFPGAFPDDFLTFQLYEFKQVREGKDVFFATANFEAEPLNSMIDHHRLIPNFPFVSLSRVLTVSDTNLYVTRGSVVSVRHGTKEMENGTSKTWGVIELTTPELIGTQSESVIFWANPLILEGVEEEMYVNCIFYRSPKGSLNAINIIPIITEVM